MTPLHLLNLLNDSREAGIEESPGQEGFFATDRTPPFIEPAGGVSRLTKLL
jgi:hypothetical protein